MKKLHTAEGWEIESASREDTSTLRNWIFLEVSCGQPIPGCLSVDACRVALRRRGEDGTGYHNT